MQPHGMESNLGDRKVISIEELGERIKRKNVSMGEIEVSGIVVIKDKDGNVKSELQITSLELNEDE